MELLLVIGITTEPTGLLLPVVQDVCKAAERTSCINHLKHVTVAYDSPQNTYG